MKTCVCGSAVTKTYTTVGWVGPKVEYACGSSDMVRSKKCYVREIENLKKRLLDAYAKLETIVCTEGDDAGVVLLSNDSPTHWDEQAKCQVYDHENFSPLGDALLELAKVLTER